MQDQYAKSITQGQATDTPSSPIGDFPELRAFYKSSFQAPYFGTASRGRQVEGNLSDAQAAQGVASRAQAIQDRLLEIKRLSDPKNYQQVKKDDGGFDFLDPDGKKISVNQYSKVTGLTPDEILKSSDNKLDRQYVNDFNNMTDLVHAIETNNQKEIANIGIRFYGDTNAKPDDDVNKKAVEKVQALANLNTNDMFKAFRDYYPNVYSDNRWDNFKKGSAQIHGVDDTRFLGGNRPDEPTEPWTSIPGALLQSYLSRR